MTNITTEQNTVVVLVALYRYLNFPIRIMHSLLENIDGIKPYTIFFQNYDSNIFKPPTDIEEDLFVKLIIDLDPKLIGISVKKPAPEFNRDCLGDFTWRLRQATFCPFYSIV